MEQDKLEVCSLIGISAYEIREAATVLELVMRGLPLCGVDDEGRSAVQELSTYMELLALMAKKMDRVQKRLDAQVEKWEATGNT